MKRKIITSFLITIAILPNLYAQRWTQELRNIDTGDSRNSNFYTFQSAFYKYYQKNPIRPEAEDIRPKFVFPDQKEAGEKIDYEEYKQFKRWEWFAEPRVYPTGRWEHQKMAITKMNIERLDYDITVKQRDRLKDVTFDPGRFKYNFAPLIKWKPLGPFDAVGGVSMGRVNCLTFDPVHNNVMYLGAPDGGIWKTEDFGANWKPIFDFQPTLSIADIAIDPNDNKTIYAATSDGFGYGSPFWGGTYSIGVLKSTDGGVTWAVTGLNWTVAQNRTIRRLAIHPTNGKILLAATSNGLYRTADGGSTWNQIWATGTYDAEFQQNDGNTAYATTSQVLKSTNAGASFVALTASCAGNRYNIEIARSNPKTLYTLCTNGTVQKSTNSGASWTTVTASGVTLYGYYDNVLAVSPIDDKIVYVAGFNIKKTTNGGTSWSSVTTAGHVDNHCIRFFPGSSNTIFCGNDGGLFKTTNAGSTWNSLNKTLAITQFYRIGLCTPDANIFICGAQDNGNMKSSSGTFTSVTNADGMDVFIDRTNCNTMYAGTQNGNFNRSTNGGASWTNINTPSSGAWISPWCQDPVTANTIYAGTNKVYKSTNQGTAWSAISGSLSGVPSFTVLKVAKSNSKVIYAGNGNKLYRTTNGGTIWTDITAGLPVATNYLMDVAISDKNPNVAWVSFSGYVAGEKVYKTTNGGTAWTNISGSLPNMPVNCLAYENNTQNAIYAGTDAGVYYINDALSDWIAYKPGLPNVIIDDLEIHYGSKKIRAATYGRGVWEIPLRAVPSVFINPLDDLVLSEVLIWWKGGKVPISQIKDPEVCPVCGLFVSKLGEIAEVIITANGELASVAVKRGDIQGYRYDGSAISQTPFRTTTSDKSFDAGQDRELQQMLSSGYKVKGVYMEGKLFKGLVLAK